MELQNIFSAVLNMTITGSIVIVCVLLARLALGKAPRVFSCALWLVVLFRLLCPVSVSAPVSVLEIVDAPEMHSNLGAVEYVPRPVTVPPETMKPEENAGAADREIPTDWHLIGARVWTAGFGALTAYGIISYVNLKKKLRESAPLGDGIREADGIRSPFVLGLLRPTIYLPSSLKAGERRYILLHEQTHIRHGDHLVKALFWLAVCIHWFNPLVWLAFVLCGRDMEMRCDEAVLKKLGTQVRGDYAQSLLNLATGRRYAPAPLAFGEGDTGKRVKHVLGWKRKAAWVAIPAAVLCAVVLAVTAVNPEGAPETPFGHSYRAESSYASAHIPLPDNIYYTLTSDMGMFIRGEKTELAGFFQEIPVNGDNLKDFSEDFRRNIRRSWHIEGSGWWLLDMKHGELQLHNLNQSVTHVLARTDLLGVSIKQPGMESYVEPTWHRTDEWNWPVEELATTLVNEGAQIVLMPEVDVDRILVNEEYYQRYRGETNIINTDYFLEPDQNGDFLLDVARRGSEADDFAVYRVTVGEEHYIFRLSFPAVPNETSVSTDVLNRVNTVAWADAGAKIVLEIPGTWEYDLVPAEPDGYAGGITFWPMGREEGKLRFEYYPNGFGVCGTGLETASMTVAGQTVSVGTYDNEELWTFISFDGDFAVWGENHESWWTEYGDEAMEILDSARFSMEGIDLSALQDEDLELICGLPVSPTEP